MHTTSQHDNSSQMSFGVQWILIFNIAAFILEHVLGMNLSRWGGLQANWWSTFGFWNLITYQFIHQGAGHLISNMIGLYFLGPETERTLGTYRFFWLYFLSGILGGIGWSLLASHPWARCIGASAAVFGIMGAYAALYPKRELRLLLFPFFPIKAWIFVLFLGLYELAHVVDGPGGRVANSAHLAGGLAGYVYALVISRPNLLKEIKEYFRVKETPAPKSDGRVKQDEVDRILAKAAAHGIHSLSQKERQTLKQAAK